MCAHCNYQNLLEEAGVEPTANRLQVLAVIGSNDAPLTAAEVFSTIERSHPINRVTVYRILDLLVQNRVVERISSGGRAAHFGLAPNKYHAPHPHFCCSRCGAVICLNPDSLSVDADNLQKTFAGEVSRIEVLVEGICRNCLKQRSNH